MEIGGLSKALDVSALREDLEYMRASNVNVSNFVSVKLSGTSNYKIWKEQMLCLLKSQALLYIVDAGCPSPRDKGVNPQYDQLVKGWMFGSVNENVLRDLIDSSTAQEVWMKLESLFSPTVSYTEGDSSNATDVSTLDAIAPVVSAMREDLKYLQALNVDVSNFVSEKLEDKKNYYTWKNDMLSLIRSHELLHIIHDKARLPWDEGDPMTQKYDSLVRGWILNTMNDYWRDQYRIYRSVQEMWMRLEIESTFTYQPETSNISNTGDTKGILECNADDSSNETEDLKYMQLKSNVNVYDFVSVKLSDANSYSIWKAQMLYFLECHSLLHIINDKYCSAEEVKYHDLVKGWLLCTINDELLKEFPAEDYVFKSANYLWEELESSFTKGCSRPEPVVSASTQDLKYTQALNVNVSSFVSVKLSGRNNYEIWKGQMYYLIESQELLNIIDKEYDYKVDKYDTLVRGWIFSTMNEQLLNDFTYLFNNKAKYIWEKLKSTFDAAEGDSDSKDETSPGFEFRGTEFERVPEMGDMDRIKIKKELYEAAVEGCWWKAKSILKSNKTPASEVITTANGNTILHLAVEMGHNYFIEKLLYFLKDGEDIEKKNDKGQTALHIAAAVGNTHAAQLLVQKREELLLIPDCNDKFPLDISFTTSKINAIAYFLRSTPDSDFATYSDIKKTYAFIGAIIAKEYDLVETLLKKFPEHAKNGGILSAITISFPTDLGFGETFIYPSFNNVYQKTIARCSMILHPNFLDKCVDDVLQLALKIYNTTCCSLLGKISMILFVPIATLYPIYQLICLLILLVRLTFSMLYFHMWKVLAVTVHPIKNIEKKRKDYKKARKILSLICDQMGTSNDGYRTPLFEAVRQDTHEVVDAILFKSPATINYKVEGGYNIIQLAIINRAEKVYNLIRHIVERKESYRDMIDYSENNLVHLAGRLAPSDVLERTTGAALQLQRELLWREEVEQLKFPLELIVKNKNMETPAMVFTREHRDLIKEGENWIKKTAESCSITAALIVTVVFAAAITVPGGSNQESGIPVFKKETAFTVFAVSNAFSLFTASTALLLYLSILTMRFSERDFLVSLPRRLIFGLLMLFLSTIAMMVAFGAILFLVFCDQRPWMLVPIFVFTCLPISVIVTVKLPLLVDLIRSTYFPIFGNRSYLESCSVNRKNTIFTE